MGNFVIEDVLKVEHPASILMQGVTNSGKTNSALLLAYGITGDWTKIGVVDSESKRSTHYHSLGNFKIIDLTAPYTPERYIEAIEVFENAGMEVIIVDSISHVWIGSGGVLNQVANSDAKNDFSAWNVPTESHDKLIEKILRPKTFLIATARSKMKHQLVKENGKMVPEKVGERPKMRPDLEYEFTVAFSINAQHQATCLKDTTFLFKNFSNVVLSEQHGQWIKMWFDSVPVNEIISRKESHKELVEMICNKFKQCKTIQQLEMAKTSNASQIKKFNDGDINDIMLAFASRKKDILTPPVLDSGKLNPNKELFENEG